jgi:putative NADH-flavin reductase
MPTYALLGATGSTGSSVLRFLLSESPRDLKLNILVRSKTKLLAVFSNLEETTSLKINIIEGDLTNPLFLQACLADASLVFMCIGQNESKSGSRLCHDTVSSILSALRAIRAQQPNTYTAPLILQLRSASLNPVLARHAPYPVRKIVSFCLWYNYADIQRACALYEVAAVEGLAEYIYVDPPTIHDADGTQRTGYQLILTEKQATALSYADLGAAMCEIARRGKEFKRMAVGVTATGKVRETWGVLLRFLVDGGKNRVIGLVEESPLGWLLYSGLWNSVGHFGDSLKVGLTLYRSFIYDSGSDLWTYLKCKSS